MDISRLDCHNRSMETFGFEKLSPKQLSQSRKMLRAERISEDGIASGKEKREPRLPNDRQS